jgi:hypothetical protein
MSHVATLKTRILDLDALKTAAAECGMEFVEGRKAYRTYYGSANACAHTITAAGASYDVGVVAAKDGHGFELTFDSWGPGKALEAKAGAGLGKLLDEYGFAVASVPLRRAGHRVARRYNDAGRLQLVATK